MLKKFNLFLLTILCVVLGTCTVAFAKQTTYVNEKENFLLTTYDGYETDENATSYHFKPDKTGFYNIMYTSKETDDSVVSNYSIRISQTDSYDLDGACEYVCVGSNPVKSYCKKIYLCKDVDYTIDQESWFEVDEEQSVRVNNTLGIVFDYANDDIPTLSPDSKLPLYSDEMNDAIFRFVPTTEAIYSLYIPKETVNKMNTNIIFNIYEKDANGKFNLFSCVKRNEYIEGNHQAFDIEGLEKDKEYFIDFSISKDISLSFEVSMAPSVLEDYEVIPQFASLNSFENLYYKQFEYRFKYQGEEQFSLFGYYNSTCVCVENPELVCNETVLTPSKTKYKLTTYFRNIEKEVPIVVIKGYDYAKATKEVYHCGDAIIVGADNDVQHYYTFKVPSNGFYKMNAEYDWSGYWEAPYSMFKITDSNNKYINYVKNEGYLLKAGVNYALYFNDVINDDFQSENYCYLVKNTKHVHKKFITIKAIPATYSKAGRTAQIVCATCGEIIQKSKVIPKKKLATPVISKLTKNKKNKNIITISWKKVNNATRYYVYRYNAKLKKYVKIATLSYKKLSFTDKKFKFTKNIKNYYVKVVAARMEGKKQVATSISKAKKIKK